MIINSLTSPGIVAASLAALNPGGIVCEVAKRDIWSAARVAQERPDVVLHTVAVDFMPVATVNAGLLRIAAMLSTGKKKHTSFLYYYLSP